MWEWGVRWGVREEDRARFRDTRDTGSCCWVTVPGYSRECSRSSIRSIILLILRGGKDDETPSGDRKKQASAGGRVQDFRRAFYLRRQFRSELFEICSRMSLKARTMRIRNKRHRRATNLTILTRRWQLSSGQILPRHQLHPSIIAEVKAVTRMLIGESETCGEL